MLPREPPRQVSRIGQTVTEVPRPFHFASPFPLLSDAPPFPHALPRFAAHDSQLLARFEYRLCLAETDPVLLPDFLLHLLQPNDSIDIYSWALTGEDTARIPWGQGRSPQGQWRIPTITRLGPALLNSLRASLVERRRNKWTQRSMIIAAACDRSGRAKRTERCHTAPCR